MSEGNGNGKSEPEEPKALEMRIVVEIGKPMIVHFPLLADKITTYGFLKMAEKTLDAHYKQVEQPSKIVHPKGGMLDFARKRI